MNNSKIGSVIVTYNPNIYKLKENINSIINQVNKIVIVDNSSNNIEEIHELLNEFENIELIKNNSNNGIAFAQNSGVDFLDSIGYLWAMILDQDSVMPPKTVERLTNTKQFNMPDTGIVAAHYCESGEKKDHKKHIISEKMVIASGNLLKIEAWKDCGGFDNSLFIDYVDYDFDARLILSGFKIWEDLDVQFNHTIGTPAKNAFLSNILHEKNYSDHSAFREYFIAKNEIIYAKRYPSICRHSVFMQTIKSLLDTRKIILFSKPKLKKTFSMLRGIKDGINYNPKKDDFFIEWSRMHGYGE